MWIIINWAIWTKIPSYEYKSSHNKFITKEKQIVGVPVKYYIEVGEKKKSTILQEFWEQVALWPHTMVKRGEIRKAYRDYLWWWDKDKIRKSIISDIVYDSSITFHVLISLLNIKTLT